MAHQGVKVRHHVPVTRQTLATWEPARFKEACRRCGLTLQQVAILMNIPYSAVRSYTATRGASPTPGRFVALARVVNAPTTDLAPLREACTLHELRWHAGLTVAELAQRVGYSISHTALVLSGVAMITEPKRWADALTTSQRQVRIAWRAARAETAARAGQPEAT
ncbi:helix-turn-helix domain-containing protein [Streptomyces sp. NPDC020800]|uniref:helix-turn-helix domain-containing protein n=1 Tax=Streptomyces sp. NPDC020800 TaxID=3365092 RepID=UPI00378DAF91